jgi:hypothetical protein
MISFTFFFKKLTILTGCLSNDFYVAEKALIDTTGITLALLWTSPLSGGVMLIARASPYT